MYVVYVNPVGIYVLKRIEQEQIALQETVIDIVDLHRFKFVVSLVASIRFENMEQTIETLDSINESKHSTLLQQFIESSIPTSDEKKTKIACDRLVFALIKDLPFVHEASASAQELLRGVKLHELKLLDITEDERLKAEIALAHHRSRHVLAFDDRKSDYMTLQAVSLLDEIERDINTFTMRIREWYSWHFPELDTIIKDSALYCRAVKYIGNKATIDKERLREQIGDVADAVYDASKNSIGCEIGAQDLTNVNRFCERLESLNEFRKNLSEYLTENMGEVAPNLTALVGERIGARLIAQAGSLSRLSKLPASTIQILGAEKALFRALKKHAAPPKHGLLFGEEHVGRATKRERGRVARSVANKCAIASRIDLYGNYDDRFGKAMREQLEDLLKHKEPKDNVIMMAELAKGKQK